MILKAQKTKNKYLMPVSGPVPWAGREELCRLLHPDPCVRPLAGPVLLPLRHRPEPSIKYVLYSYMPTKMSSLLFEDKHGQPPILFDP